MSITIRNINLIISSIGLVLSLIGMMQTIHNKNLEKGIKPFFYTVFSITIAYVTCILIRELIYNYSGTFYTMVSRIVLFGQSSLSASLTLVVTAFLLYQAGEKQYINNIYFKLSALCYFIYLCVLVYGQFNNTFYYVDNNNQYFRGEYFPLIMIMPIINMIINVFTLLKYKDNLSNRQKNSFIIYALIPSLCMLIQSRFFGIHLIVLGIVVSVLYMFMYSMEEQRRKIKLQEEENFKLKNELFLAQIRPHFLFNALTTIKYLINTDPNKADEAITYYIDYLRHNIESIARDELIDFEDELEHVKGYLEIQKIRFEDELNVEYDIRYKDFKIPTLTLLPLVENAVSYGIRRNEDRTGTIIISSIEFDDHIEICVEDNGPGFVPDALPDDSKRSHVGIQNVRNRIEGVGKGELIINSVIGKGTKAIILLPINK